MSELEIHVGTGVEELGQRFIAAWNRAEAGDLRVERHLSFDSFETLAKVLTPKRLQLLKHIHTNPSVSVAALARELGRDYKRVHEDVDALANAGLLDRPAQGTAVIAPYDVIQTRIAL